LNASPHLGERRYTSINYRMAGHNFGPRWNRS
jgi:hypothetical protein